ncbi:MAG: carboxypeptidase regulatory-like domain-containing protein, partial [Candidatus Hydrogenedentes bacterium]|nr:carboxypeptidase regulatory-like domain-containing protein [Candidatus Hydrogenedentota bacterium]
YYEVTGLTPGDYMLKFETLPAGYATVPGQRWERINLKAGQSLANVDFQVIKAVTITGTVVDSAGKPVVGARVSASTTNNLTRAATTSDDAGVFTLTRFAAGDSVYFTAASDAARLSEPITATIGPEGIPDLRLVLDSVTDASISGIVVDQNGGPIEAFVSAFGGDRKGGRTQSKGDGAFEINPLAAGHYELRLGRITDPMQTEVVAGSVDLAPGQHLRNLRLVYDISKSASISGHVMDAGGKPIESAVIYFGEASSVPVSSDGSYVIYDSPSEPLTINASADGYASQRRRNVAWGSTDVDFVLETLSPVTGEVRDAATKQLITRFRAGLGTIPPIVTPAWRDFNDPGGKFSLPPDSRSNSLFVQAEGYREVQLRLRSAGTEPVIVLMDRAVAVRGRVIDQTGAGVADAAIYLERLPRGIAAAPVATTDATGAFEIGLGGSESIYIYADHGGYSPGFTVASGGSSNVTIRLTPASSVSGIVTMDGAPVPDCHVALRHSDSMPMFGFSARTDTDGRFIIGQVPAGNLIVEGSMDVEDHYIAEGETPVTVPPGGSVETILELHLVDVDPEPAAE